MMLYESNAPNPFFSRPISAMEHISGNYRLRWVREDPDAEVVPNETLALLVDRLENGKWIPVGTGAPMLSVFPLAAPEAMRRGALEVFAELLNEVPPETVEGVITHLLWYNLTDKDVINAALRHVPPDQYVDFVMGVADLSAEAAQKVILQASDEQLAAITIDDATRLLRHPNPDVRARMLRMFRKESSRLTGIKR